VNQHRAVARNLDGAAIGRKNNRIKANYLSFSAKCDLPGSCEISFEGSMIESLLSADRFPVDNIFENRPERAYIDLMGVRYIDDAGIKFLLQLMKIIEREGIKFQLLYAKGQVSSMIESSGLSSYFSKPTWGQRKAWGQKPK
jgi:anti-anti-sigma factor